MAWRIHEAVVRGEIDNRVRGRVTGRLWLAGRTEPVELEFAGNAWRDLAGHRLEFVNPRPVPADLGGFGARQHGVIGDCTASRKVRVPDVSMEEFDRLYLERKPFPWHWGNSLYLEWFSPTNGRVVIESADYTLTIDPEAAWEMTPAEEAAQHRANAEAMGGFMSHLADAAAIEPAVDEADAAVSDDDASDDRPMTEAEAEKMQEDSDRLADRINARVKKEGIENFEQIMEEELERQRRERGEEPLTPEEEEERDALMEDASRAAEEAANDPELQAELAIEHPLVVTSQELAIRLMQEPEARGWIPPDANEEHAVIDLASSVASGGAKLAGALNGYTWPPEVTYCAQTIVGLKRARAHFGHALLAAAFCVQEKLADAAWLAVVERELDALCHACDMLVGELRARLERER
ncbi:MAG TPA: hypothetical protein VGE76_16600 [Opitutaceae bacterium]